MHEPDSAACPLERNEGVHFPWCREKRRETDGIMAQTHLSRIDTNSPTSSPEVARNIDCGFPTRTVQCCQAKPIRSFLKATPLKPFASSRTRALQSGHTSMF